MTEDEEKPELRTVELYTEPSIRGAPAELPLWHRPWVWVLLGALLLTIVVAWWMNRRGSTDVADPVADPVEQTTREPAVETAEAEQPEPLVLPALDASDEFVRSLVATVSTHPKLVSWLASDELVRRFSVSVVNVAEGVAPRAHLGFMAPKGDFQVTEQGGRTYIDGRSYGRYDLAAQVFSSVDATGVAQTYWQLKPLVQQAYADLGYPGQDFDGVLKRAIRHLLATPVVDDSIAVEVQVTTYDYADSRFASLSSAQQQLLRMGPSNVRRVRDKLQQLEAALGL